MEDTIVSPKFRLIKEDMLKVGKGALIATSGALLTYALQVIPTVDFGQYTPIVVALASILINAGLKYFQSNEYRAE